MEQLKYKILLVEDEQNLGNVIRDYLNMGGFDTTIVFDGETGLKTFKNNTFDLCILDVMLPKMDGFTLAKEIKSIDNSIPIIFLTAKSMKEDRIKGLKLGADDYITKPFSTEELSLRIDVILKRVNKSKKIQKSVYFIGKYTFDYPNFTLTINNKIIILTSRESDLLKLLCMHKNSVLHRSEAMIAIWGGDYHSNSRSMDVYVMKLRKILKDDPKVSIQNIHGSGFKLQVLS